MRTLLLLLPLTLLVPACANDDATSEASSEVNARTTARRAQLARLQRVDALARLYVGHELDRKELRGLGSKNEAAVIEELVKRPDFKTRFSGRLAEFMETNGKKPTSRDVDPNAPLVDAFSGAGEAKKAEAQRFGRWLVRELAPRVADELLAKHDGQLAEMTYKELLDAIRTFSANPERGRTG